MKRRYALLLANSEYREMKLARLPLPGEGWEGLAHWLRDPHGGGFQGVEVVQGATLPQTLLAIERFFGHRTKDDTLLLWFGGQAIVDSQGETYLCLRDSDRLRLKSTAVMAGVLAMHMDAAATPDKLLILDCRFHAFAGHQPLAETLPVLRPERSFIGRGESKHVLIAEPTLHVHSHVEAEGAQRAARPLTRAFTAICREQSEDLQGLALSDLYPSLCRRLGQAGKPEWYKIGEAKDFVLTPAARTEMVTAMTVAENAERGPRDLDSLDWERLSGEIPLDALGLGRGQSQPLSGGVSSRPGQGSGPSSGTGPGPSQAPGPGSNPDRPASPNPAEPSPANLSEPASHPLDTAQEAALDALLDGSTETSVVVPKAENPSVAPLREAPETVPPPAQPSPRPSNTDTPAFKAPPRLHPEELLGATLSMLSPEALEVLGPDAAPKPAPVKPEARPPEKNPWPGTAGLATQVGFFLDPETGEMEPTQGQTAATKASATPEAESPIAQVEDPGERLRRAMEAEAEREREEVRRQEAEIKAQAEALERWKHRNAPTKAMPAASQPTLQMPTEPPSTSQVATSDHSTTPSAQAPAQAAATPPMAQAKVQPPSPSPTPLPLTGTHRSWIAPDAQQTQFMDAESVESLREALEASFEAPTVHTALPTLDLPLVAPIAPTLPDLPAQTLPTAPPIPPAPPTPPTFKGSAVFGLMSQNKHQGHSTIIRAAMQEWVVDDEPGTSEQTGLHATVPGLSTSAYPGGNTGLAPVDAPQAPTPISDPFPVAGPAPSPALAPAVPLNPAFTQPFAEPLPETSTHPVAAAWPDPGLERPPIDLNDDQAAGHFEAPRPALPWVKIVLVAVSMLLPLILAAFLLLQSGLLNRLRGHETPTVLPAETEATVSDPADMPVADPASGTASQAKPPEPARGQAPAQVAVQPQKNVSALSREDAAAMAERSQQETSPTPVHVPAKAMAPPSAPREREPHDARDEQINRDLKVALQRQVQKESAHLAALYERYVLGYPDLQGIVNLRLEVGGDGRIRRSQCASSTTGLTAFDEDIARLALGWRLTGFKSPRPKFVTLPLRFPLPGQ